MAAPPEVSIWTAADLKAQSGKLAQKLNEQKGAFEQLASFGNHLTMLAHREGDGTAEIHETQVDFFFVQSGTATLVYGGELPGAKTTAPASCAARPSRAESEGPSVPATSSTSRPRSLTSSSSPRARSSPTS
jgi:hypothetical protein